jgi:DNA-binding NtrC family response regulator
MSFGDLKEAPNVLIVDDDPEILEYLGATLTNHRCNTFKAETRQEASFKVRNQRFDTILMDLRLGGTSSVDLIKSIRTDLKNPNIDTPVIVISGTLDIEQANEIKHHIQYALVKPFNMEKLLEYLSECVLATIKHRSEEEEALKLK